MSRSKTCKYNIEGEEKMKAKRNLLALLLSVAMLWQGFSVVRADNPPNVEGAAISVGVASSEISEEEASGNLTASTEHEDAVEMDSSEGNEDQDEFSPEVELPEDFDLSMAMEAGLLGAGSDGEIQDAVDFKSLTYMEGGVEKELTATTPIAPNTVLIFKAELNVQNKTIKKGNFSYIQLPDALKPSSVLEITITSADGSTMAVAKYEPGQNRFKLVYDESMENYSGGNGHFTFGMQVNSEKKKDKGNLPIVIKSEQKILYNGTLNYQGVGKSSEPGFWKQIREITPYEDANGVYHYFIHYYINVNGRTLLEKNQVAPTKFTNVVIGDQLVSTDLSYVKKDSDIPWKSETDKNNHMPYMYRGTWVSGAKDSNKVFQPDPDGATEQGPDWAVRTYGDKQAAPKQSINFEKLSYLEGDRAFEYKLGDLEYNDGLEYHYFVEIKEKPVGQKLFENNATIKAENLDEKTVNRKNERTFGFGSLNGTGFNIIVKKVDENDNPLSGVEFSITNDDRSDVTIKSVTTGSDGTAGWAVGLGNYTIKETKKLDGYILDKDEYKVSKKDLQDSVGNENSTVIKKIVNKKKPEAPKPATRDIAVEKKWGGDPNPAQPYPAVEVVLWEDGVETNKKVTLSADNNWKASFSNLPKNKAAGGEIAYTVKEVAVSGYTAKYSGDSDNGFKIMNTPDPNTPNNPDGGGNTPPGGGGGRPRVPGGNTPNNPGDNGGNNPPPSTPDRPGEVHGATRPSVGETEKSGEVLGESRPAVKGRAAVATEDQSAMKVYALLFALSAVSLFGFSVYGKNVFKKKEN